jgi:hypothetical protein
MNWREFDDHSKNPYYFSGFFDVSFKKFTSEAYCFSTADFAVFYNQTVCG